MKQWFVLYTKLRSEKKVSDGLEKIGIEVFCPMTTEIKQWSDRKKKIVSPLIPSHIFVLLENNQRDQVFQISGVVRYLFWLGKPAIVPHNEIEILKEWLEGDSKIKVEGVQTGDIVKIEKGPFKGEEGVVKEIGENRLQLLLVSAGLKITITKKL